MTIRTAAVASAQGIDCSDFQGQYDWQAAKHELPQLAFGVFRLTQGLGGPNAVSPDPDAAWNHQQIAANGLRRGAYHFLDPHLNGAAQAGYFTAEFAKLGLTATDMLWLDNETAGSSPAAVSACARAFMAELDKLAPHNPRGVYTYIDFARSGNCDGLSRYPLWLAYPAQAAPVPPPPWHVWCLWQWGQRNGTDADAFNGTAAEMDAWIASFAPKAGPYRHMADGQKTLAEIAAARNTTPAHLLQVTASALTAADLGDIARLPLPEGFPWYSTNP